MSNPKSSFEQPAITRHLLYWTILIIPISLVIGGFVAFFLWLLDLVTAVRWQHSWLIFLLPFAGVLIVNVYKTWGKGSDAGNNLIMDEIHTPGGGIPWVMTPLILFSTIITHLFGGSAGREGTAVQMGGSIASFFSDLYGIGLKQKRLLLMCGMSAGFGAVFGTPVAGAVFALEVLARGRISYDALLPCLISSVLADLVCSAFGVQHTIYSIPAIEFSSQIFDTFSFDLILLIKVILAGIAFGLVSYLFSIATQSFKSAAHYYFPNKWLIPVAGGSLVIIISLSLGTFDYLGLGVTNPSGGVSILSAFSENGSETWSWFWKLLLTAITLSTGFKGGEVTPLFFIGVTLGNTLAVLTGSPVGLFAALGFIAVFAGATNTPIASTLMGVELFGSEHMLYFAIACFTAYYFSGHTGIYSSQKIAVAKTSLASQDEDEEKRHPIKD